jgi:hypothetical protein
VQLTCPSFGVPNKALNRSIKNWHTALAEMPPQLGLVVTNVYQCHVDRFRANAPTRHASCLRRSCVTPGRASSLTLGHLRRPIPSEDSLPVRR